MASTSALTRIRRSAPRSRVTLKRAADSSPSQMADGQPIGRHHAHSSRVCQVILLPRKDGMHWILRLTPWMLATVVVGVMTHAAAAGSFTRGCAARDFQLLTLIEEQEKAGTIAVDKISDALLEMMHARIVCYNGRVVDALAIYDAVADSVRPIRTGRVHATGIE